MVTFGLEENIHQVVILFGAFVGNFIATMPPFWKEKFRFEEFDLKIFFDHKFLGTALVTGISSFVLVSMLYNSINSQIDANATVVLAFLAAAAIGAGLNKGVNLAIPSPNVEQKAKLKELQKQEVIDEYEKEKQLAALETIQQQTETTTTTTIVETKDKETKDKDPI